jgi:hypothetical protein
MPLSPAPSCLQLPRSQCPSVSCIGLSVGLGVYVTQPPDGGAASGRFPRPGPGWTTCASATGYVSLAVGVALVVVAALVAPRAVAQTIPQSAAITMRFDASSLPAGAVATWTDISVLCARDSVLLSILLFFFSLFFLPPALLLRTRAPRLWRPFPRPLPSHSPTHSLIQSTGQDATGRGGPVAVANSRYNLSSIQVGLHRDARACEVVKRLAPFPGPSQTHTRQLGFHPRPGVVGAVFPTLHQCCGGCTPMCGPVVVMVEALEAWCRSHGTEPPPLTPPRA